MVNLDMDGQRVVVTAKELADHMKMLHSLRGGDVDDETYRHSLAVEASTALFAAGQKTKR
jgi:hypothetical protein